MGEGGGEIFKKIKRIVIRCLRRWKYERGVRVVRYFGRSFFFFSIFVLI